MARAAKDAYRTARERLFEDVADEMRRTAKLTGRAELSPRVLAALLRVPRHEFVPPDLAESAYINRPLGIGHGQTISQPYIVALMTDVLDLAEGERVLEIGTGSGYQTAVLAEIAAEVYTVEVVPELARTAEAVLARLDYRNVRFRIGSGRAGWPEAAPFPAIIVTAAAESIPNVLVAQLAPGGRMIIPVGPTNGPQNLIRVERAADGTISETSILSVAFVPLVGRE